MRDADGQAREPHDASRLETSPAQAPPPHENHTGSVPLHQPVAVAPVRSIHGPNGILGGSSAPGPLNGPMSTNPQLGAPTGPSNLFASGSHANQTEPTPPRSQPAPQVQPPQQVIGGSFGAAANQAAMAGQGQQPILNVSALSLTLRFCDLFAHFLTHSSCRML